MPNAPVTPQSANDSHLPRPARCLPLPAGGAFAHIRGFEFRLTGARAMLYARGREKAAPGPRGARRGPGNRAAPDTEHGRT